jgi:hypothetical protein
MSASACRSVRLSARTLSMKVAITSQCPFVHPIRCPRPSTVARRRRPKKIEGQDSTLIHYFAEPDAGSMNGGPS